MVARSAFKVFETLYRVGVAYMAVPVSVFSLYNNELTADVLFIRS